MTYLRLGFSTVAAAGLFLGFSLAFSAPAAAQARQINPQQACQGDAFRLCNDYIPDRAKVGACLRRNARALSPDCRTVVMGGGRHGGRRYVRRHHRHR